MKNKYECNEKNPRKSGVSKRYILKVWEVCKVGIRRIKSWRSIGSEYTTHKHLNCIKYTFRRKIIMLTKSEHFRNFWSNEYGNNNNNNTNNSITYRVDCGFYFFILTTRKNQHESSPYDKYNGAKSTNKDNKWNSYTNDITCSILCTRIENTSSCCNCRYERDIHKK